jgi:hypothetical protein
MDLDQELKTMLREELLIRARKRRNAARWRFVIGQSFMVLCIALGAVTLAVSWYTR